MVRSDKILLWSLGTLVLLGGLCICCLGAAVVLPFNWLARGGPSQAARSYLRESPIVRERIGPSPEFGLLPSGAVQEANGKGTARLEFSLKGSKGDGRAQVALEKQPGKDWVVVWAQLEVKGEKIRLKGTLSPLEAPPSPADEKASPEPVRI